MCVILNLLKEPRDPRLNYGLRNDSKTPLSQNNKMKKCQKKARPSTDQKSQEFLVERK